MNEQNVTNVSGGQNTQQEGTSQVNMYNANANANNERKPFITVNVKGVDIPFTEEQVRADLGKGRLYDAAKKEASQYKKTYNKVKEIGITDEVIQALIDARDGNEQAREYFINTLIPNQDDDNKEYRPKVEEQLPSYLEEARRRNDGSYDRFLSAIEGEAEAVYKDISSLDIDSRQKEVYMKAFMDDINSGAFDEIMPLAYAINAQSNLSFLESYVQAGRKLVNIDKKTDEDYSTNNSYTQGAKGYSNNNNSNSGRRDFSALSGEDRQKAVAEAIAEMKRKYK